MWISVRSCFSYKHQQISQNRNCTNIRTTETKTLKIPVSIDVVHFYCVCINEKIRIKIVWCVCVHWWSVLRKHCFRLFSLYRFRHMNVCASLEFMQHSWNRQFRWRKKSWSRMLQKVRLLEMKETIDWSTHFTNSEIFSSHKYPCIKRSNSANTLFSRRTVRSDLNDNAASWKMLYLHVQDKSFVPTQNINELMCCIWNVTSGLWLASLKNCRSEEQNCN